LKKDFSFNSYELLPIECKKDLELLITDTRANSETIRDTPIRIASGITL